VLLQLVQTPGIAAFSMRGVRACATRFKKRLEMIKRAPERGQWQESWPVREEWDRQPMRGGSSGRHVADLMAIGTSFAKMSWNEQFSRMVIDSRERRGSTTDRVT